MRHESEDPQHTTQDTRPVLKASHAHSLPYALVNERLSLPPRGEIRRPLEGGSSCRFAPVGSRPGPPLPPELVPRHAENQYTAIRP